MRTFAAVLAAAAATTVFAQTNLPQFPGDWQGFVIDDVDLNQGGQEQPDGSICCEPNAPECKVQTINQAGMQYFSVSQQAIFLANPDQSGVVQNFTALKEYAVDANHNCQSYCPIDPNEAPLTPLGFGENATNWGKQVYPPTGQSLYDIHWYEAIIFNITMEIDDFFVNWDGTSSDKATPVALITQLTPFGEPLGVENSTWTSFEAKSTPASMFVVKGAENCPIDQSCAGGDDDSFSVEDTGDVTPELFAAGFRVPGGVRSQLARRVLRHYASHSDAMAAWNSAQKVNGDRVSLSKAYLDYLASARYPSASREGVRRALEAAGATVDE